MNIELTKKEERIVLLTGDGLSIKEIASILCRSYKTIAKHRNNITKKIGAVGQQNGLLKFCLEFKKINLKR